MNVFRQNLLQSCICTAVFATIFGLIVACSGKGPTLVSTIIPQRELARLVSHTKPVNLAIPSGITSTKPFMATLFQSSSGSSLQQTFDGQGPCLSGSMPSTGYIPIWYYMENGIGGPFGKGTLACSGVFSQIGGGVDQISGQTLANPGVAMFESGTLTTLVVTGVTVGGAQIRCSDLTTTASVNDGDMVQPYFVIASNSIIVGIGTQQLPFVCNLNVPPGDQVYDLVVQFAKV